MKKSQKYLILFLILSFFMMQIKTFPMVKPSAQQGFSEIVMERESKRLLHEKNADQKLENASTTKIVTAITVIELCDINEEVTVSKSCVGIEGSSIYLNEGEVITVEALLYGLMLRSGNDAACCLAEYAAGSIEKFAVYMNGLAVRCGAKNSNFVNPHGLHDDNHYTTARDLALITCYALKNPIFQKIVSTDEVWFKERYFKNKNKLIGMYEGADGVKTGFTKDSGRCLVSSATRFDMQFVCVLLNCSNTYEKTIQLFDSCFELYKPFTVVKENDQIANNFDIEKDGCGSGLYKLKFAIDLVLPLTEYEQDKLNIVWNINKQLKVPLNIGNCIGKLLIYADKDLIFSAKLYTIFTDEQNGIIGISDQITARWSNYAGKQVSCRLRGCLKTCL